MSSPTSSRPTELDETLEVILVDIESIGYGLFVGPILSCILPLILSLASFSETFVNVVAAHLWFTRRNL